MFNKSILLTILGFLGFCLGCLILFFNWQNKASNFHEIKYRPEEIARVMLIEKRDSVRKELDSLRIRKIKGINIDSIQRVITKDSTLLRKFEKYYTNTNFDSSSKANAETYLRSNVGIDLLTGFDTLYRKDTSFNKVPLQFSFYDKTLNDSDRIISESYKTIDLPIYEFTSDVDLFSKYPGFGIWSLCILAFCCCFAMTIGFSANTGIELTALWYRRLTVYLVCTGERFIIGMTMKIDGKTDGKHEEVI